MVAPRERGSTARCLYTKKRQQIAVAPSFSVAAERRVRIAHFVLCKARRLCYTLRRANPRFRLFLGSSAVEHSTVNRMVAGSNPARGASKIRYLAQNPKLRKILCVGTVWANQLPRASLPPGRENEGLCRQDSARSHAGGADTNRPHGSIAPPRP